MVLGKNEAFLVKKMEVGRARILLLKKFRSYIVTLKIKSGVDFFGPR